MPGVPDGIRVERSDRGTGHNQLKVSWLGDRGFGDWFGSTRGRGSLALGICGLLAISYVFVEVIYKFVAEGNTSALYFGIMLGGGILPLIYLLLCESYNQRVIIVDSDSMIARWRPFPGFNSWKKPRSTVIRLLNVDYCLYAEFSDGQKRFLLPRDMTGERHAFVRDKLEEELGLCVLTELDEVIEEEPATVDEVNATAESTEACSICGTAPLVRSACTTCGADFHSSVPLGIRIVRFKSRTGHVGVEMTVTSTWELIGFGLLPTMFALTLPGSVLLAGGMAALPIGLLLLLPALFLFYVHLLESNRCIIRIDDESLSVRYEPVPRPGWSRPISKIERLVDFPRVQIKRLAARDKEPQMVTLVALTKGIGWSPQVLHTFDKHVYQFVRRTVSSFLGKGEAKH